MSKNSYFTGQPIYAQILKLMDKSKITSMSRKYGHDRYVKKLDGYTHLASMLYGVLQRYDSLRELVLGMLSDANKLQHLGLNYCVRRSTLSEANSRRDSRFFEQIYCSLYNQYKHVLSDSSLKREYEKKLYILDSTTIRLFSNVLKGVGRNPISGKKKGGVKAHCLISAQENVPQFIRITQAATHDHTILKEIELARGSFLAIDRAYIDYTQFEKFTQSGVYYVTKMKKNLTYKKSKDLYNESSDGMTIYDEEVIFTKGEVNHKSRRIEYWDKEKRRSITLLSNNFELADCDIIQIYKRRWQIEMLFKQLKQNFPLKYFFGDSVNAIQIQLWVTFIANLLLTVIKRRLNRGISFSNMTSLIRQMLMSYIDLISFLNDPEKEWRKMLLKPPQKHRDSYVQMALFE